MRTGEKRRGPGTKENDVELKDPFDGTGRDLCRASLTLERHHELVN